MRNSAFVLVPLVVSLLPYTVSAGVPDAEDGSLLSSRNRYRAASTEPTRTSGTRGARFLGLLGLLTGLTLVDSLDDESDRPRRSGYVKIDVGRPSSFDGFYGAYGYGGGHPYWTSGSSINIKIPFGPGGGLSPGGEFETMALFPFPVPYPGGPPHFGPHSPHGGSSTIEPRPSIFADPVSTVSNASETVLADDVEPSTRRNKSGSRKSGSGPGRSRTKVSPPRTIRSTIRADGDDALEDDAEPGFMESPETTETAVSQDESNRPEDTGIPPSVSVADTSAQGSSDSMHGIDSDVQQASTLAAIAQDVNYVTQPAPAPSYHSHPHSLADVSVIDLTTAQAPPANSAEFQPSRADHWQDYYSSVAHDHLHPRPGFLPVATPAY